MLLRVSLAFALLLVDAKGNWGGFFIVVLGLRLRREEGDGDGEGGGWVSCEVWISSRDK